MTLHMAWTIIGTVDDIYRPGAITAAADDSLEQTATRLQDKDISALVIMDGVRLGGIITERDIVRAVADRRHLADAHRRRIHDLDAGHGGAGHPAGRRRPHDAGLRYPPPAGGGRRRGDRHGIGQGSA
jgi:CBS domain-containing protein